MINSIFNLLKKGTIKHVKNAKVVVFGGPLESAKAETKGVVLLTNATELLNFSKGEEEIMEQVCISLFNTPLHPLPSLFFTLPFYFLLLFLMLKRDF